jgi:hypothetical protein
MCVTWPQLEALRACQDWKSQRLKKKKRGYRVCSSGYAATDTS